MYNHQWIRLPDGRLGIVHHIKPDGTFAIRPVTDDHKFYPHQSPHWSMEDRIRIPEEVVLDKIETIPTPSRLKASIMRRIRAYFSL